jgi:hypothetical protein
VAFAGTALLLVVVGVLGLRVIADSNDRVVTLQSVQRRASAYRELQTDAAQLRALLALRTSGPGERAFSGAAPRVAERNRGRVDGRAAFISFDIDMVDPAYAPGTGTPEAGGPSARDALPIVRRLTGIDFVGFDGVDIPAYDPAGQTAPSPPIWRTRCCRSSRCGEEGRPRQRDTPGLSPFRQPGCRVGVACRPRVE